MNTTPCPRCPTQTLTQCQLTEKRYTYKCFKCNVQWRVHKILYCMKCDHPHISGVTTIDSSIEGLIDWIVCDNCESLIHTERGTAKRVDVVEYL